MLGIGGADRRPISPNGRIAGMQGSVRDDGDGTAHGIDVEVASAYIGEVLGRRAGIQAGHALQTGIGADSVQTEQQARLQDRALQGQQFPL